MSKNPIWKSLLSLALVPLLYSCVPSDNKSEAVLDQVEEPAPTFSSVEMEIIEQIDRLLFAAGNADLEALNEMVSDKAMIGISVLREGAWVNSERTIKEYYERVRSRDPSPFSEIPTDYEILVSENQMALVKADGIVHEFGVPKNREINHFTMMKENGQWRFLNISFTVEPIAEADQKFNLDIFARSYAQAWGSQRPNFVSAYFAQDGALQVNDGTPAIGTEAISEVAHGFMSAFSDLTVVFDSLVTQPEGTEFHWTLTGTNDGPEGSGNAVRISGYELWQLNEEGLIQSSKGFFSAEEYKRQIEFGFEE